MVGASLAATMEHGKIVYGEAGRTTTFSLQKYAREADRALKRLEDLIESQNAPSFRWAKHCGGCEYSSDCRAQLVAHDDLSLLGGISQKEISKHNAKGIFTVNQLSYTFRPKKRRQDPPRVNYALKALALRERQTYIQEVPSLPAAKTAVYLDCEGLSNAHFVYLIGMLVTEGPVQNQVSLWANSQHDEEKILKECLDVLSAYTNLTVYHYGSYETRWLRRFKTRLSGDYADQIDNLLDRAVNVLTMLSSSVYPPTYTNSLKDIARFLGFRWSEPTASGLQSTVWRKRWELSKDSALAASMQFRASAR